MPLTSGFASRVSFREKPPTADLDCDLVRVLKIGNPYHDKFGAFTSKPSHGGYPGTVVSKPAGALHGETADQASAIANEASRGSLTKEGHEIARDAHKKAAELHRLTGNLEKQKHHNERAAEHQEEIQMHERYRQDREQRVKDEIIKNAPVKKLVKAMKLPGGKAATYSDGNYSWTQRGGYTQATNEAVEKALAAGFSRASGGHTGNPDGSVMGSEDTYTHPDGWVLYASSSYGNTKSDNWHMITLRKKAPSSTGPSQHG